MDAPPTAVTTVADLIDRLCWLRAHRPPGDAHGNGPERTAHLMRETDVEQSIQAAEVHYDGPCVHAGRLWWTHNRPRTGIVGDVPVYRATDLPWPPVAANGSGRGAPAAPPPPEKLAGFVSEKTW